ncbi:unnamed protein product [Rotaria sp. Silwood2]|nr:unnamed protein product [Rotaria sp. Silwood2]CAF3013046.1 unnamed protein product [Rotaria sp. Silwood2]CAF4130050.1 unnamed protein product [Rotaria sp. Silwood2]CAF4135611.1 unnamed protein product [Rotaria sp. Silwood2]
MTTSRNILGADVFDQNLEHVALLSNQLVPNEYFTKDLAEFCDHAAYHGDIHSISMPIVLLNVAATSTEKSGIWRSNGASSGGVIVTALQRKSNGSQVDTFFERLTIWCLRPPPLMFVPENEKKKPTMDRFPSFEEFCVILGLFENFELYYDVDGDKMMVDFGNKYTALGMHTILI